MEFKGIVLNYCHDSRVNTGSSLPSLIKEERENLSSHIQSKKRAADKINRDDVQASCDTESDLLFLGKLYRSHFFCQLQWVAQFPENVTKMSIELENLLLCYLGCLLSRGVIFNYF